MLFNEDWFVQLLEGPEEAVRTIFDRVAIDPRHADVDVLVDGACAQRRFPGWSMAFVGAAPALRRRFAASPLASTSMTLRGQAVVDFIVALAHDGQENA